MLQDNIKTLRKQKGYTQETLAQELNVVRQTVSKWEKGFSVPDAVMIENMAELFEVSVSELLGTGNAIETEIPVINKISEQLSVMNNQIAKELNRKRKVRKTAIITLISLLCVLLFGGGIFAIIHYGVFEDYALNDGRYVLKSYPDGEDVPYLLINGDEFNVIENIAMNYQPSGRIERKGKEVIMASEYGGGSYKWVFRLTGDSILSLEADKSTFPPGKIDWNNNMVFVNVNNSMEFKGNIKSYVDMGNGMFECDGYTYKYRLEISGRMPRAAENSTFVYLSNIENISFEQAYLAAGLSSNSADYFSPEDAVLVDWH